MKQVLEFILVMACVGLLSACATTRWEKSTNVTVAWDAPTLLPDGTPIPEDMEIMYNVYIVSATDKTHDDKELLTKKPISKTVFTIDSIENKGKYFIGVQAIFDKDKDGRLYDGPMKSPVVWSSSETDTESGSFGIIVE